MDAHSSSRRLLRPIEQLERRDTPAFATLPPFFEGIFNPTVVATADFNGDGFADVAIGNLRNSANVPSVGIALGKGDGTFTVSPELTNPLLNVPQSIVAEDLNGDGHIDLAVGSFGGGGSPGSLLAFFGKGDGTFSGPAFQDPNPTIAVGVADFNGDGIPDILAVNPAQPAAAPGGYRLFTGTATGKFALATVGSPFAIDGTRIAISDFDNDGNWDFIALDAADRQLFAFFGNGKGGFVSPAPGFIPIADPPSDIAVADFDLDARPDLVISSITGVSVYRNLGSRQFDTAGQPVFANTGTTPYRIAVADFNGDFIPDIVGSNDLNIRVFLRSSSSFIEDASSPLAVAAVTLFSDVAPADVNGDGNPDLIAAYRTGSTGSSGSTFINLALIPTVTTVSATPNPAIEGQPVTVTAAVSFSGTPFPPGAVLSGIVDFSVNGAPLGSANVIGGVATLPATFTAGIRSIIARYQGNARFQPSVSEAFNLTVNLAAGRTFQYEVTGLPTLPGLGADRVASGRIVSQSSDIVLGAGPGRPAEVSIINGETRVEVVSLLPFGPAFTGGLMVAAGDIDGDGTDDVAVAADEGGGPRVSLYLTRNGQLELANNFFALDDAFRGGLRIALGDVDGDGRADLVVAGGPGAGPRIATYDARSLTGFQTPERLFNDFFALDPDTRLGCFVAVGDLDGDGFAEIAVSSDFGGGPLIAIWDGESLPTQPERTANFFAGNPDARGGLRIAIRDISVDEGLELIVGDGPGAGSTVRVYVAADAINDPNPAPLISTELMPGFLGGVFVA